MQHSSDQNVSVISGMRLRNSDSLIPLNVLQMTVNTYSRSVYNIQQQRHTSYTQIQPLQQILVG